MVYGHQKSDCPSCQPPCFRKGANNSASFHSPHDIHPIAIGETLHLGKCLSAQPSQCPSRTERIAHGLRACIEKHWFDKGGFQSKGGHEECIVFNLVSHHALSTECSKHFPKLLPLANWCYSQHPFVGDLNSELGIQQGDPHGPFLSSLYY